ncbi:hypothetical protein J6590_081422 [Homalodisca vitripennis]|nr:hypothetical protein J6590_081422 [Homalodisca vitripennis]
MWHAALSHHAALTHTTCCDVSPDECHTVLQKYSVSHAVAIIQAETGDMEWSNQKTTLFIEDYHNTPELWDNRSAFYKDRNIKCDKLKQLAIKYDCSVTDLKKKVKYLRSAFHREHKRITKPKSGSSPKKEKWFAYNLLTFLLDVDIPRETFSKAETLR